MKKVSKTGSAGRPALWRIFSINDVKFTIRNLKFKNLVCSTARPQEKKLTTYNIQHITYNTQLNKKSYFYQKTPNE
jgi:hypothetical protein